MRSIYKISEKYLDTARNTLVKISSDRNSQPLEAKSVLHTKLPADRFCMHQTNYEWDSDKANHIAAASSTQNKPPTQPAYQHQNPFIQNNHPNEMQDDFQPQKSIHTHPNEHWAHHPGHPGF